MTSVSPSRPRYHAFDSLRGSMMLLGVVAHIALPYTALKFGIYSDRESHASVDALAIYIHVFRMPIFFMLAGFFGALVCARRGAPAMALNRAKRVLAPLILGWALLGPFIHAGATFARAVRDTGSFGGGFAAVQRVSVWLPGEIYHLWFLAALTIFYAVMLGAIAVFERWPRERRDALALAFRSVLQSRWRFAALLVPVFLTLGPAPFAHRARLTPLDALALLGTPFTLFALGWILHAHADLLPSLQRRCWTHVGAALVLAPLSYMATRASLVAETLERVQAQWLAAGVNSIVLCAMLFGLTGAFLRHLDRPIPVLRYLGDASYWLYLAHYPLVLWLAGLLAAVSIPGPLKLLAVLGVAVPILLVTYHYGVRFTVVGEWLNGRRAERRSPAAVVATLTSPSTPSEVA